MEGRKQCKVEIDKRGSLWKNRRFINKVQNSIGNKRKQKE